MESFQVSAAVFGRPRHIPAASQLTSFCHQVTSQFLHKGLARLCVCRFTSHHIANLAVMFPRGQPADVLPSLFKEWGTTYFTFEEDPEPFGRVQDHLDYPHFHAYLPYVTDVIMKLNEIFTCDFPGSGPKHCRDVQGDGNHSDSRAQPHTL